MRKWFIRLVCISVCAQAAVMAGVAISKGNQIPQFSEAVNPVIEWNKALLVIVRTPGAQPATIHPTRSFAIMHAAIYDAVNAIDRKHRPYLVSLSEVSPNASQEAAAAAAAHEVLAALYPAFKTQLAAQLQQSLARIADGQDKTDGIAVGMAVADRILALRSNDGSNDPPIPYIFGTAPGDYQSTPPNFPPQPQFTEWGHPELLERNYANGVAGSQLDDGAECAALCPA